MAENPGAESSGDPDGRLDAPNYGNQPDLFVIRCRDPLMAARYAAAAGFWLHAWRFVHADLDEPTVEVVGEPDPPWTPDEHARP